MTAATAAALALLFLKIPLVALMIQKWREILKNPTQNAQFVWNLQITIIYIMGPLLVFRVEHFFEGQIKLPKSLSTFVNKKTHATSVSKIEKNVRNAGMNITLCSISEVMSK